MKQNTRSDPKYDRLQATFFADDQPQSSVTFTINEDKSMQAFYSLDDSADPPTIDATHSFEIGGGYAGLFSLATANSGYGELPDETARTVVVELIRDNKVAYGPFLIPIPNEMID